MTYQSEIEALQKKYDTKPEQWFAALAEAYRKSGELEEALRIVRSGIQERPNYVSGHIVLGRCLVDSGTDDEAERVFENVLDLDAENIIALKVLGEIAERREDLVGAQRWLDRLLEVDPSNDDARRSLTRVQTRLASSPAGSEVPPAAPPAAPAAPSVPPAAAAADASDGLSEWVSPDEAGIPPEYAVSDATPVPNSLPADDPGLSLDEVDLEPPGDPFVIERAQDPLAQISPPEPGAVSDLEAALGEVQLPPEGSDLPDVAISLPEDAAAGVVPAAEEQGQSEAEESSLEWAPGFEASTGSRGEPAGVVDDATSLPPIEPMDLDDPAEGALAVEPAETEPVGSAGNTVPAAPSEPVDSVVTETMAEVYAKQGLVSEAREVYERLLESAPDNVRLRAKLAELDGQSRAADAPASTEHEPSYRADSTGGVSARDYLAAIVKSRPGDASRVGLGSIPPMEPPGLTPHGADVAATGAPARPADNEVSLSSVFEDGAAERPGEDHTDGGAQSKSDGDASTSDDEDDFQAWLESLKT